MPKKPKPNDERVGSLGAFIRAQREMANLSLRQVAAMTEISNAYLSQIERDLHEPSIRILTNVGKALGIAPEVLLSRAGLTDANAAESGEQPGVTTEEAIQADPHLSQDEKQALLTVYRSYRSSKQ